MIQFSCSCGMKFKVKDDFAGRKTSCPTCKQALVVPSLDKTQAYIPKDQIDGTPSSVHQAGMEGGVTLEQAARPGQKPVQELLARQSKKGERYIIEGEIARGGMGAVLRAVDCDIRREVAVKYLLNQADARSKARFIEEAQITGQLEHPNIPPVHELGADKDKRLFFSMKMVKGRSLAQVLDELRKNPKTAERDWSLGRLLNIFVNVCNGLAYAHSRGVVHRDLKPANIMVGDFGEVYAMDWGLAKILKGGQASEMPQPAASVQPSQSVSPKRSSKVETSREPEADLTQEGSVLGTPVYMPPEQATGNLQAINEQSDIYSLGAILYELLTLQPPVDKEGGYLAILMRVMQGEIVPPEQREPKRARAGKIPNELAAVAMKAMAKDPANRYPNVEALRKDIERFQEGRSVSAKEDTKREMIWKFVKRNKAFSATTAVATVLLTVVLAASSVVNYQSSQEAKKALVKYTQEQMEKEKRTEEAVPALIRSAKLAVKDREFDDAFKQAELALAYKSDSADAMLLKGQVLIVRQDFPRAIAELEQYLTHRPDDGDASELLDLCRKGKPDDVGTLLAIGRVFHRQQTYSLVDGLLSKYGKDSKEARQYLVRMYREVIEKAAKGWGGGLRADPEGLHLSLEYVKGVNDLSPLRGVPLATLNLHGCNQVQDLTPLQGMRLTGLDLYSCTEVRDLTPLKGMPLIRLNLRYCSQVRDLRPLEGMPLKSLYLHGSGVSDLKPLKGTSLTEITLEPDRFNGRNGRAPYLRLDVLREMKTLGTIRFWETGFSPAEFWKKYDAGEFNK